MDWDGNGFRGRVATIGRIFLGFQWAGKYVVRVSSWAGRVRRKFEKD